MMQNLILGVALVLMAGGAQALTLTVQGGQLMGASNVDVGGSLYDVVFYDGTCIDLYGGCDQVSDFTFQSKEAADAASEALNLQVFIETSIYNENFESSPALTNGCENTLAICVTFTPYGFLDEAAARFAASYNINSPLYTNAYGHLADRVGATVLYTTFDSSDPVVYPHVAYTFAKWSAVVPEPSTALLLSLGLTGLVWTGRKRNRS